MKNRSYSFLQMIHYSLFMLFVAAFLVWTGCVEKKEESPSQKQGANSQQASATVDVVATKVTTAPTLDGKGEEEVWNAAQQYEIPLTGYSGDQISMKVVYTDTDIFFLVSWSDYSHSIRQEGSWGRVHVGGEFGKAPTEAKERWERFGAEDMLSIIWNLDSSDFEAEDFPQKAHLAGFKTSQGKMDRWLWKAGTTDPVHLLLDQYIDQKGIHDDSGTSFLVPNFTDQDDPNTPLNEQEYPRYMPRPDLVRQKIPKLFIIEGEKPILLYYQSEVEPFDLALVDREATLPGYIFAEESSGSITDIKVRSSHSQKEERWTLEIQRKLTTATPEEDIQFADLSKAYPLVIGVFDNTNTDGSFSGLHKLVFAK